MTGSRADDEYVINRLITNNVLDERNHNVTKYLLPVRNNIAECDNIGDIECLMQCIGKEERRKYEPFEFIVDDKNMVKQAAGMVVSLEHEYSIHLLSFEEPPQNAYSCRRCYFKYRMETLVDRMSHALLPVCTNQAMVPEPRQYYLIGMKKKEEREMPGYSGKMEKQEVKRMVAVGISVGDGMYLLAHKANGLHLLRLRKFKYQSGLCEREVFMIVESIEKSSDLDKIFADPSLEIRTVQVDTIYGFDGKKNHETNIFAENHSEYEQLFKKAYPDDVKFAEIRERVDKRPEFLAVKKRRPGNVSQVVTDKKADEKTDEKNDELLSGWMKTALAIIVLVAAMILTFQIIKPTDAEDSGETRDVPVF